MLLLLLLLIAIIIIIIIINNIIVDILLSTIILTNINILYINILTIIVTSNFQWPKMKKHALFYQGIAGPCQTLWHTELAYLIVIQYEHNMNTIRILFFLREHLFSPFLGQSTHKCSMLDLPSCRTQKQDHMVVGLKPCALRRCRSP